MALFLLFIRVRGLDWEAGVFDLTASGSVDYWIGDRAGVMQWSADAPSVSQDFTQIRLKFVLEVL